LDVGETLEECVIREVEEETGLKALSALQFASVEQPITHSEKHYLHFGYIIKDFVVDKGVAVSLERDFECDYIIAVNGRHCSVEIPDGVKVLKELRVGIVLVPLRNRVQETGINRKERRVHRSGLMILTWQKYKWHGHERRKRQGN
jgi:ADP-ribose pyrophosphatase YjhB (NUDIX family)